MATRILGRLPADERRAALQRLTEAYAGLTVRVTIAQHRDADRETFDAELIGWAVPMFGTASDLLITKRPGYLPAAYSASRLVTVEPLPAPAG